MRIETRESIRGSSLRTGSLKRWTVAKDQLYLVARRHDASNEVYFKRPVNVCTTCGCVFVHIPGNLGQCPLKHDQKKD